MVSRRAASWLGYEEKIQEMCVLRWQRVGERAVLCCMWDGYVSVERELEEALVMVKRRER